MCGRYSFAPDTKALVTLFDGLVLPPDLERSFNIAPTQPAYVVTSETPKQLMRMAWGLVPPYAKTAKPDGRHINARAETVFTNAVYRDSALRNRCCVPADSFYEWKRITNQQKQPYRILLQSAPCLMFAGIWSRPLHADTCTFSIITTTPNREMSEVHNRMPVIFTTRDECELWLNGKEQHQLEPLLRPLPDGSLRLYPISSKVGSYSVNDESLHLPQAEIKTLFD